MSAKAYQLRKSTRAKAMRVSVYPDARVVVTVPRIFSLPAVERFLAKHAAWIERAIAATHGKRVINVRRADIADLKKRAAAYASLRASHFANRYGVEFGAISIRAQKSRWGSCSHNGDLSFNYKLAVLPAELADYIVVHEICHRLEMNHSKKFWAHVSRAVPDHKLLRKQLRETAIVFS